MPGKKLNIETKLKTWQLVAAVVTSVTLIAGGVGVYAYQQYTQSQQTAGELAQSALDVGQTRVDELTARIADLEAAINNSLEIQANSEGKTLDEKARDELSSQIEKAKELWVEQKTQLIELENALAKLRTLNVDGVWAENTSSIAKIVVEASKTNWEKIVTQVADLGNAIGLVQAAQEVWQEEQDRIIAQEAAERMAREKTIAPISTLTDTGGATAPSAPAPPPAGTEVLVAPVEEGSTNRTFIVDYIKALSPTSYISWVTSLCDGYYVCGRAWVGGFKETPVKIELDPALEEIYINNVGVSVLVHEAAHARQWLKYGADIISANEAITGKTGTIAVEYMADCATIVKLGYSTNVYTRNCSPSELEAAATIW